jgi:hypothetical protein
MEQCEFCGSLLPPNARFCGHCGRTPSRATGGTTDLRDAPTRGGKPQHEAIASSAPPGAVPGNEGEQEEWRRRTLLPDGPLPIFPGGSGQPSAGVVPMVQGAPQFGGVPMVPVISASGGAPTVVMPPVPLHPSGSSLAPSPQMSLPPTAAGSSGSHPHGLDTGPGALPSQPAHKPHHERRGKGRTRHHHPHGSTPRRWLLSLPIWLIIILISLVIASGSAGAWVWLFYGHLPGTAGSSSAPSRSSSSVNAPPAKGKGETPTDSPIASSCAASTAGATPGAGIGTDLTFSFSGAAPQPMCIVRYDGCTIYTSGIYYEFTVLGTVQGKVYTFHFQIGGLGPSSQNYSGPGTYTTNTGIGLGVGDHPVNPNQPTWMALTTGTITVNGGEKSGSVHALLNTNDQTSGTVQATGTWACSPIQHL